MHSLSTLSQLPEDPIYGLQVIFKNDTRPHKINLSIGICKDKQGKALRFKGVELAEEAVCKKNLTKEYLPLTGLKEYTEHVKELVCGSHGQVVAAQTVGGTGALYVAARLLLDASISTVYIPDLTWVNHEPLFKACGHTVHSYCYYNRKEARLDFAGMCQAVDKMTKGTAIIIQASCHNPTGIDLDKEQFKILSKLVKERGLIPIFDLAYQGFGSGVEEDAAGIRLFLDDGHEMMVATTFAKNFGLYNDRMGALMVNSPEHAHGKILSHIRAIVRSCYSSPPAHGANIIHQVFTNKQLLDLWKKELFATRERLTEQRTLLFQALQKNAPRFTFDHIMRTKGLFCLFDIAPEAVAKLRDEHALYIAHDGRICLTAVTEDNVESIAKALATI